MAAGSEGVVMRYSDSPGHVLVRFWDGGPFVVPIEALVLVKRPQGLREWLDSERRREGE
jgi:hypothetical protein